MYNMRLKMAYTRFKLAALFVLLSFLLPLTSFAGGVFPSSGAQLGGPPTGAAGGDLGSSYPNPTVTSVSHVSTGILNVANGGTQCGAPTTFAGLPGSPVAGEICDITDSIQCTSGSAETVGGGTSIPLCQLVYTGTQWLAGGSSTPNGTGAAASSVAQSIMGPPYFAKCDGVTDDSAAFGKATATGGSFFIPTGTVSAPRTCLVQYFAPGPGSLPVTSITVSGGTGTVVMQGTFTLTAGTTVFFAGTSISSCNSTTGQNNGFVVATVAAAGANGSTSFTFPVGASGCTTATGGFVSWYGTSQSWDGGNSTSTTIQLTGNAALLGETCSDQGNGVSTGGLFQQVNTLDINIKNLTLKATGTFTTPLGCVANIGNQPINAREVLTDVNVENGVAAYVDTPIGVYAANGVDQFEWHRGLVGGTSLSGANGFSQDVLIVGESTNNLWMDGLTLNRNAQNGTGAATVLYDSLPALETDSPAKITNIQCIQQANCISLGNSTDNVGITSVTGNGTTATVVTSAPFYNLFGNQQGSTNQGSTVVISGTAHFNAQYTVQSIVSNTSFTVLSAVNNTDGAAGLVTWDYTAGPSDADLPYVANFETQNTVKGWWTPGSVVAKGAFIVAPSTQFTGLTFNNGSTTVSGFGNTNVLWVGEPITSNSGAANALVNSFVASITNSTTITIGTAAACTGTPCTGTATTAEVPNYTGHSYRVTTAGTTGTAPPTFPTTLNGTSTSDNGVIWTEYGPLAGIFSRAAQAATIRGGASAPFQAPVVVAAQNPIGLSVIGAACQNNNYICVWEDHALGGTIQGTQLANFGVADKIAGIQLRGLAGATSGVSLIGNSMPQTAHLKNVIDLGASTAGFISSSDVVNGLFTLASWIQGQSTEFEISAGTGALGSNTAFPTGTVLVQGIATNNCHFTELASTNVLHSACTTAPTFNVFDTGANTGTAKIAATATQAKGTGTTQAETLTVAAGDAYGIYVSTQGATCTADTFNVTAELVCP